MLTTFGIGAKTNVGYGQLRAVKQLHGHPRYTFHYLLCGPFSVGASAGSDKGDI